MVELELNGQKVTVPDGSMVMHAAEAAGTYVPHFCYHKKLSIAANCRMCLVEVEKAPKPVPACATPVTQGMIVRTHSEKALAAQKSVMEFLLINHPLDCPICDQGGECQLQDLAVGYGGSATRYAEEKRVVFHKNVGPLISMEEMSRCIHCTRCVRFGQEIAGVMELGMLHRGEHAEITTFVGQTVDSELSGNMIDICPVGALTSKPFRYSARTWEMSRRKSVSPHDSTGANLVVQVKNNRVLRVVPQENEAVNECWISDRDRFSYEALNGSDRLTAPRIKQGGQWQSVDWTTALKYVADGVQRVKAEFGADGIGAVASETSTLEELYLLKKLINAVGSRHVGTRTRHADTRNVSPKGARWLGQPIAALSRVPGALVIGSFLRSEHPLFASRLRAAARSGAAIHRLHSVAQDWAMPLAHDEIVSSDRWLATLAGLVGALATIKGDSLDLGVTASAANTAWAQSLLDAGVNTVLLGNQAEQHPQASELQWLADAAARLLGGTCGVLGAQGNSVGAQWVGAAQADGALGAAQMLAQPMKALFLLNVDGVQDARDAEAARAALAQSGLVVSLSPFASANAESADVQLPIAPYTETAGTYVNAEGRVQSAQGVVPPLGETRPGWKVLRVLGNLLNLPGFDQDSAREVATEALQQAGVGPDGAAAVSQLSNAPASSVTLASIQAALSATGDAGLRYWPSYQSDLVVRRAASLQKTRNAQGADITGQASGSAVQVMGVLAPAAPAAPAQAA
ncbi:NADH-quinone oxidoreductase subunit NuoG [Amphibiibacter pelophylacis]|uniref:NADH-quinone oxidoreductase subunit NuoG n=1 Tax=Amphibiibacter pelophylacis TaxID=1799477 RepID=A0ACC6P1Q9_9BURK